MDTSTPKSKPKTIPIANLEMLKQKRRESIRKRQEQARKLGDTSTSKAIAFITKTLKEDAESDNTHDLWIGVCDHLYPGIDRNKVVHTIKTWNLQAHIFAKADAPAREKWTDLCNTAKCNRCTCHCIRIANTWKDCGIAEADAPIPAAAIKAEKP
jgi:hypothetical protein